MPTPTIDYVTAWATLGSAIGTLGLAAGTFWMAKRTSDLARGSDVELRALTEQTNALKKQASATSELAQQARSDAAHRMMQKATAGWTLVGSPESEAASALTRIAEAFERGHGDSLKNQPVQQRRWRAIGGPRVPSFLRRGVAAVLSHAKTVAGR